MVNEQLMQRGLENSKIATKYTEQEKERTPKKNLFSSLVISGDERIKNISKSHSITEESALVHPKKKEDGWVADIDEPDSGKVATIEERTFSSHKEGMEIAEEIGKEYEEYFENAPESMRIYMKGEGQEGRIGVAVYEDTDEQYAEYIAYREGTNAYDASTLEEIDSLEDTGYDESVFDVVTDRVEPVDSEITDDLQPTITDSVGVDEDDPRTKEERAIEILGVESEEEARFILDELEKHNEIARGNEFTNVKDLYITSPSTGEKVGLEREDTYRRSVVVIDDQTAINIRAAEQLPAKVPTDLDKFDGLDEYVSALADHYEKDPSFGQHKDHIIDSSTFGDDVNLFDEARVSMWAEIELELPEEKAETLDDLVESNGGIDNVSDDELADEFTSREIDSIRQHEPMIERAHEATSVIDFPSTGCGGSAYPVTTIDCGKNCSNCGNHKTYLYMSYRDASGTVNNKYMGKA